MRWLVQTDLGEPGPGHQGSCVGHGRDGHGPACGPVGPTRWSVPSDAPWLFYTHEGVVTYVPDRRKRVPHHNTVFLPLISGARQSKIAGKSAGKKRTVFLPCRAGNLSAPLAFTNTPTLALMSMGGLRVTSGPALGSSTHAAPCYYCWKFQMRSPSGYTRINVREFCAM